MIDLLEKALEIVRGKRQWYAGETVTVVEAGRKKVWIREYEGQLKMIAFREADRLTARYYSPPLLVGWLGGDGWIAGGSTRADYRAWLAKIKADLDKLDQKEAERKAHSNAVRVFTNMAMFRRDGSPRLTPLPACNDGVGMKPTHIDRAKVRANVQKWMEA